MEDVQKKLLTKSKRAKMEQRGKFISFRCIALIVAVVVSIFYFVASKGLATFFKDKINVFDFLFGTNWNPSDIGADGKPMVGALPMIAGSFIVTFLSAIVATPFEMCIRDSYTTGRTLFHAAAVINDCYPKSLNTFTLAR